MLCATFAARIHLTLGGAHFTRTAKLNAQADTFAQREIGELLGGIVSNAGSVLGGRLPEPLATRAPEASVIGESESRSDVRYGLVGRQERCRLTTAQLK